MGLGVAEALQCSGIIHSKTALSLPTEDEASVGEAPREAVMQSARPLSQLMC